MLRGSPNDFPRPMFWLIHFWLWGSIGVVLLSLLQFMANLPVLARLRPGPVPQQTPLVSVLVPARNEARRIGPCLQSLLAQDYPHFECIVLDDQSDDDTFPVVQQLGFLVDSAARFRVIAGRPLPPNWIGKPWACHQLSQVARGEFLLFTDADTVHHPGAISATISLALRERSDLLTAWTYQITRTFAEKLMIPFLFVAAAACLPHWLLSLAQRHPRLARWLGPSLLRGFGTANGQFVCIRRQAYQRIGGHAAVANHLVEDVALARAVAAATGDGLRLTSCDGTTLVHCRMYHSFPDLWEGFTKNLWPLFENDFAAFTILVLSQVVVFALPFFAVPWLTGWEPWLLIALILLLRALITLRYRTSWISVLFHPFGYLLALAIALNSLRRSLGKGVTWKGRLYQVTDQQEKPQVG
jgi:chlorobactene glucosyltransferase